MPDLNLQSEAVRGEIDKVTSFWLDRGVDGFRLDAVIYYNNNNQTETIDDLTWLVNNVKSKRPMLIWLVRAGLHTESMRSTIRVELTVCSTLIFTAGWIYWKGVNGAANHGASTYGNALVDVENEIKKYTDSYIDAPFIQIMIWDAAQDITTEIMPRRKPRWHRL